MLPVPRTHGPSKGDLARGSGGLAYWGAPIAVLLLASVLGQTGTLSFAQEGLLLLGGTVWFGATCLINAVRCGRTHCWIDGVGLPALAMVAAANLLAVLSFPWSSYTSALWAVVLVSFVAEWIAGPYPRRTLRISHD